MSYQAIIKKSIGIILLLSVIAGIGSFILDIISFRNGSPQLIVKKSDRFSCELRMDTTRGKDVWTVIYDSDKRIQPWLGIVIPMGGGWTPARRCEEIERRLDNYRQDGLVALFSRTVLNTPGQEVICAKTLSNGNNCSLVLTLNVGVDGYVALQDMTEALRTGETVYHSDEAIASNSQFSPQSPFIYLEPYLALEDLP